MTLRARTAAISILIGFFALLWLSVEPFSIVNNGDGSANGGVVGTSSSSLGSDGYRCDYQQRFWNLSLAQPNLEYLELNADKPGVVTKIRVIRRNLRFPLLRIEQDLRDGTPGESRAMVADHLLVRRNPKVSDLEFRNAMTQMGLELRHGLRDPQSYLVAFPPPYASNFGKTRAKIEALRDMVEHAEPDFLRFAAQYSGDPELEKQWALHNDGQTGGLVDADIDATEAWATSRGNEDLVVAVLDSGIDTKHPDLQMNLWVNRDEIAGNFRDDDQNGEVDDIYGWSYLGSTVISDQIGHGTHCAGVIGAVGRNGIGISGVAPQIRFMAVKVMDNEGIVYDSACIDGMDYATSQGVFATSNSYAGAGFSKAVKAAIDRALNQGILCVCAAGNEVPGQNLDSRPSYPAAYTSPNIISVAATNARDQRPLFSNFGGRAVDLAAPGVGIYSTLPGGTYGYQDGTSAACPIVAGACALVKSAHPVFTWQDVRASVLGNVDKLPSLAGKVVTGGRLNVWRAVESGILPRLTVAAVDVLESKATGSTGNGDGIANPGETLKLAVSVKNEGSTVVNGVVASLSTSTLSTDVSIALSSVAFGNLAPGATLINNTGTKPYFVVQVGPMASPGTVNLLLELTDAQGHLWTSEIPLEIASSSVIAGRVTRLAGGSPLKGAVVSYQGPVSGSINTLADGTFRRALPVGDYKVSASLKGFETSPTRLVTLPADGDAVDFVLGRGEISVTPSKVLMSLKEQEIQTAKVVVTNKGDMPLNLRIQNSSLGNAFSPAYVSQPSYGHSVVMSQQANYPQIPWQEGFELGRSLLTPAKYSAWWEDEIFTYYTNYYLGQSAVVSDVSAVGSRSLLYKDPYAAGFNNGLQARLRPCRPKSVSFWVRPGASSSTSGCFSLECGAYNSQLHTMEWYPVFQVKPSAGGVLSVSGGGDSIRDADVPFQPYQWHRIEFRNINWAEGNQTFDYWVNDALIKREIPFTNRNGLLIERVHVYNETADAESWWDEIQVLDQDESWMSSRPKSTILLPGQSVEVEVTASAVNQRPGSYNARLHVFSNDPLKPVVAVPVTMKVAPHANSAPKVADQRVVLDEDTIRAFTIQADDPDGDDVKLVIKTLPKSGKLRLSPGGQDVTVAPVTLTGPSATLYFAPAANTAGPSSASINWCAKDYRLSSRQASVTFDITAAEDPPDARMDEVVIPPKIANKVIDVLKNDHEPDRQRMKIVGCTQPESGTAVVTSDNKVRYTPNVGFEWGVDRFYYTIEDSKGLQDTASVQVSRGGSISVSGDEDRFIPIKPTTPQSEPKVSFYVTSLPLKGRLFQTTDGSTPTKEISTLPALVENDGGAVLFRPERDENGVNYASFDYQPAITDAATAKSNVTVSVHQIEDPPLVVADRFEGAPGANIVFAPIQNDRDSEGGDLSLVSIGQPTYGTVTAQSDGTVRIVFDVRAVGIEQVVPYIVRDATGLSSAGSITIITSGLATGDWLTFGGSQEHSGLAPAGLAAGPLQELWRYPSENRAKMVAVSDGKLVYTERSPSRIVCLDAGSGLPLWVKPFPSSTVSPPTLYAGGCYVVASSNSNGYDYSVSGYELQDGALRWMTGVQYADMTLDTPPAVGESGVWPGADNSGLLFNFELISGAASSSVVHEYRGEILTPSLFQGRRFTMMQRWGDFVSFGTTPPMWKVSLSTSYMSHSMPKIVACSSGIAAVVDYQIRLQAVDTSTRKVKWVKSEANGFAGSPAIAHGSIFAIHGSNVAEYSQADGTLVRTYAAPSGVALIGQPVLTPNDLIVASTSNTYIFSLGTTTPRQTLSSGGYVSVAGGSLYVGAIGNVIKYGTADATNPSPVASSAQVTTVEDTAVTITLDVTDVGEFSTIVDSLPASGRIFQTVDGITVGEEIVRAFTIVSDPQNRVIYVPDHNVFGNNTASFSFHAQDNYSSSGVASVQVNIAPVNDPPVAVSDVVVMRPGELSIAFRPLANDQDVDGDVLSVMSFTQPSLGAVTADGQGGLVFTRPSSLTEGTAQFVYSLSDGIASAVSCAVEVRMGGVMNNGWVTQGGDPSRSNFAPVSLGATTLVKAVQWYGDSNLYNRQVIAVGDYAYCYESSSQIGSRDLRTGALVWTLPSAGTISGHEGGRLITCSFSSTSSLSRYDAVNRSFETQAIKQMWTSSPQVTYSAAFTSLPAAGSLYQVFSGPERLTCWDASTGVERYTLAEPGLSGDFAFHNGRVWACGAGRIQSRLAETGQSDWSLPLPDGAVGPYSVACSGDFVCVSFKLAGVDRIACYDASLGVLCWDRPGTRPALAGGIAYCVSSTRTVDAIQMATGLRLRRFSIPSDIENQPVVTGDTLIVPAYDGTCLFNLGDGALRQTLSQSGPVSVSGTRLVIFDSGYIYCYSPLVVSDTAPTVAPRSLNVVEDESLEITLTATDDHSTSFAFVITELPAKGVLYQRLADGTIGTPLNVLRSAVHDQSGRLFYVPPPDAYGNGLASFSYQASDGSQMSTSAVVTFNVTPVNDVPEAQTDVIRVSPGEIVSPVYERENDIDRDGEVLTLINFTQPAVGRVIGNPDGSLRYESDPAVFSGTYSFDYRISDPQGNVSDSNVVIAYGPKSEEEWHMFGKNAQRTSFTTTAAPLAPLTPIWSYSSAVEKRPVAVAQGVVFLSTLVSQLPALVALDQETGSVLWSKTLHSPLAPGNFILGTRIGSPIWFDGKIAVSSEVKTLGSDNALIAVVKADDGTFAWRSAYSPAAGLVPFSPLTDSTLLANDSGIFVASSNGFLGFSWRSHPLFAPVSGEQGIALSHQGGYIYSLANRAIIKRSVGTGDIIWHSAIAPAGNSSEDQAPVSIDGDLVYAVNTDAPREIICYSLVDQTVKWRQPGNYSMTPAVANGVVYVQADFGIEARHGSNGVLFRTFPKSTSYPASFVGPPVITEDLLVVPESSVTRVFDRHTGALLQTIAAAGTAVIAADTLFISTAGAVQAYAIPPALTFTPSPAPLSSASFITVTPAEPGASIRYTLDGSAPTLSSAVLPISGSIQITPPVTVRAIAVVGSRVSRILDAEYPVEALSANKSKKLVMASISQQGDEDGDGMSNEAEILAGTNPLDRSERFEIAAVTPGTGLNEVVVKWRSVLGRTYQVECSADLKTWLRVSGPVAGDGGEMSVSAKRPEVGGCFFRIRLY